MSLYFQSIVLSLVLVLCSLATVHCEPSCYFPNGVLAGSDAPCYPTADQSFCCGLGFTCSSNGLCENGTQSDGSPGDDSLFRGSCTDITWKSSACPNFCLSQNEHGSILVNECQANSTASIFCCGDPNNNLNCNCSTDPLVTLGPISTYAIAAFPTTSSLSTTSVGSTSVQTTTAAATTTQSSTAAAASATAASSSNGSSLSTGAVAGIAVGAALAGIIITALAFLLWRSKRTNRNTTAGAGMPTQGNAWEFEQRNAYATKPELMAAERSELLGREKHWRQPPQEMPHDRM